MWSFFFLFLSLSLVTISCKENRNVTKMVWPEEGTIAEGSGCLHACHSRQYRACVARFFTALAVGLNPACRLRWKEAFESRGQPRCRHSGWRNQQATVGPWFAYDQIVESLTSWLHTFKQADEDIFNLFSVRGAFQFSLPPSWVSVGTNTIFVFVDVLFKTLCTTSIRVRSITELRKQLRNGPWISMPGQW